MLCFELYNLFSKNALWLFNVLFVIVLILTDIFLPKFTVNCNLNNIVIKYSPDKSKSLVSKHGNIELPLSDLDDLFFEVIYPEDARFTYRTRLAKGFGSSFEKTFTNSHLVPVEPFDACSVIKNQNEIMGRIAFIKRGECSFMTKAINVEKAGALAAVICDNDPTNDVLVDMIHDGTDGVSNIPSVFMLFKDGYMLKKSIEAYKVKYATINIPLNLTYKNERFALKKPPWSY